MKKKILNFILVILLSGSLCYAETKDYSKARLVGSSTRREIVSYDNCDLHKQEVIITTYCYRYARENDSTPEKESTFDFVLDLAGLILGSDNSSSLQNCDYTTESVTYNLLNPNGTIAIRDSGNATHHISDDVHYLIVGGRRLVFGTNTGYLNSQYSYNYLKPVYNETRIIAQKNSKYGLVDVKENTIIPFQYSSLVDLNDGALLAKLGYLYGTLSILDGRSFVPIMYDSLKIVSANILIAKKDGKYGMLSNSGAVIVPVNCDKIKSVKMFSPVYSLQRGELYGLADKYGRVLADIKYKKVKQKGDSLYVSIDGKNWELVDAVILK